MLYRPRHESFADYESTNQLVIARLAQSDYQTVPYGMVQSVGYMGVHH
jgi:hypothetical protein